MFDVSKQNIDFDMFYLYVLSASIRKLCVKYTPDQKSLPTQSQIDRSLMFHISAKN